jgi:hypothetical protein
MQAECFHRGTVARSKENQAPSVFLARSEKGIDKPSGVQRLLAVTECKKVTGNRKGKMAVIQGRG